MRWVALLVLCACQQPFAERVATDPLCRVVESRYVEPYKIRCGCLASVEIAGFEVCTLPLECKERDS